MSFRVRGLARTQAQRASTLLRDAALGPRRALRWLSRPRARRRGRSGSRASANWAAAHAACAIACGHARLDVRPRTRAPRPHCGAPFFARWPDAAVDAAARADRILAGDYDLLGYRGLRFDVAGDTGRDRLASRPGARPQAAAVVLGRRSVSRPRSTATTRSSGSSTGTSTGWRWRARVADRRASATASIVRTQLAELAGRESAAHRRQLGEHARARLPLALVDVGAARAARRTTTSPGEPWLVDMLSALDRQLRTSSRISPTTSARTPTSRARRSRSTSPATRLPELARSARWIAIGPQRSARGDRPAGRAPTAAMPSGPRTTIATRSTSTCSPC